jgi:hypothetical protein
VSTINAELAELLVAAGCGVGADIESAWSRVVMVHNVSRVPRGGPRRTGTLTNRGFNLLLLDDHGEPSHYVKCRQAGDATLQRETRIMAALHAHPDLQSIVPSARALASERLELHVAPYVEGENFQASVDKLSARAWASAASGILLAADRVADLAPTLCAELASSAGRAYMEQEVNLTLRRILALGLPPEDVEPLRRAIAIASAAPRHAQHGDLWPANIVRTRTGWQFLDFEDYGIVQMPLFDTLHLVRYAPGLPTTEPGGWLGAMSGPDTSWTRAIRGVVAAAVERGHLSDDIVTGATAYYLVAMAVRLHERGNPRSSWEPVLLEASEMAARLRDGESPARRLVA